VAGSRGPILVRRGVIEGHTPPVGGDFRADALLSGSLVSLAAPYFGVHCVDTTERVVALTYDDGPHPFHTPSILDALAELGLHATFFVLTPSAQSHPDIIRRIVDEGHEVALHGGDHRSLLGKSTRQAVADVRAARDALVELSGADVRLYRPPYGHHTPAQARGIRQLGLDLVIWSSDGLDWIDRDLTAITSKMMASVFPGAILLLHDDRGDPETLRPGESLPSFDKAALTRKLVGCLRDAQYTPMTAGELLRAHPVVLSGSRERMLRR
jgi:peptidoglycan/xylan/chitin deacetylase (PgdA/CDA1 family)